MGDAAYLGRSRSYLERKYGRNAQFLFAAYIPVDNADLFMYNRSGQEEALLYQRIAHSQVAGSEKRWIPKASFSRWKTRSTWCAT